MEEQGYSYKILQGQENLKWILDVAWLGMTLYSLT